MVETIEPLTAQDLSDLRHDIEQDRVDVSNHVARLLLSHIDALEAQLIVAEKALLDIYWAPMTNQNIDGIAGSALEALGITAYKQASKKPVCPECGSEAGCHKCYGLETYG